MATYEQAIDTLNDLIQINNDRAAGYEKAINELKGLDIDLRTLFQNFITNSRRHVAELTGKVLELGGTPANGTTVSGKVYRAWMDLKTTFKGEDRIAVLSSCEFGEDAAQNAYRTALSFAYELPTSVRQIISEQQQTLKKSHDAVKELRDTEKVLQ
jgi:uncharacterized protein (TIGR02284 family)